MDALPDLELETSQPVPVQRPRSGYLLGFYLMLVTLLMGAIVIAAVLYGTDNLRADFGLAVDKPVDYGPAISNINNTLSESNEHITAADEFAQQLNTAIEDTQSGIDAVKREHDELKSQFATFVSRTEAELKKLKKKPAAKPLKSPVTKSNRGSVYEMSLISIRVQGGNALATVRSASGEEFLMMEGDSWKGWTLLSSFPERGQASFRVNDRLRVLML